MFRAGLYARVSTSDQQTLAMQNRAMCEYAARRGWTIALQVREVNSGATRREAREKLLEAARRREIDIVLVWRLDRWGRSVTDLLATLQELEHLVPADKLCVAMSDAMAALEREASALLVSEAADRIFRLVTAVKDYSYMDREPVQDVNVAESLETVLQIFQPRLAGITVRRFFSPELPSLQAFGSELNQAWAAIIENSLDAMGDSGTLTLSVRLQGKTILVEITDTGQGIPEESASRVFEPFFTTKPFGTGLGLGLDTVQRVIQKHFGAVAFDSKPGKTTLHVRLPLDRTEVY